jgi:hypothetical protein
VPAQASLAAPERGSFSQEVTFQPPAGPQPGTVEAYSGDPKDGSIINVFSVPVVLAP